MSVKKNLIDQKEYLKKYLSGDKKKKKKKHKKHKTIEGKVIIIDDDIIDADNNNIDEELLATGEDAPQIVGEVIEEEVSTAKVAKWRSIAIKDEPADDVDVKVKQENPDADVWGRKASCVTKVKDEFSPKQRKIKLEPNTEEVLNLPRKHKAKSKQRNIRQNSDSDLSPARKRSRQTLRNGRQDSDSDLSLPRRRRGAASSSDSDMSLPRRRRNNVSDSDSDLSPPRRTKISRSTYDSDLASRKRNGVKRTTPQRQSTHTKSRGTRNTDSDLSPARKRRSTRSPQRRRILSPVILGRSPLRKNDTDSDLSPPRRRRIDDSRQSNPFKREIEPPRRCDSDSDLSPPRIKREKLTPPPQQNRVREISMSPPPTHKMRDTKTLDGKKAGLQEAHALKAENEERRRAEERLFENMSKDVSGRDAEVAVRSSGRKGRRAREAQEEDPEERRQREKREQEKKELYDRWGKGVKQVEDRRLQLAAEAYESSKPLARYSNDEDLDRHLREQERSDDPMLEYMRKKKREQAKDLNIPVMPKYEGTYPENRFGIAPGYRWDGVDRSNGYEKRWFDVRNEKRALEDEAYKYSVEDM